MGSSGPRYPRKRLRRFEASHDVRFLTFSCHQRLALFANPRIRDRFAEHLNAARLKFRFHLFGWVVMPEHVHLLLWPCLPQFPVSTSLRELKRGFAIEVLGRWRERNAAILRRLVTADGTTRFWLPGGGHDRNIVSRDEFNEKLVYIDNNPVARGLVERPEQWAWSSARWYLGDRSGPVGIDPRVRPTASGDRAVWRRYPDR